VGAVAAGFIVKGAPSIQQALLILGGIVTASAACALAVRFSAEHKAEEQRLYEEALALRALQSQAVGADAAPAR
jgi:NNP family nitrate/nitrite transporter-like MFS transporter